MMNSRTPEQRQYAQLASLVVEGAGRRGEIAGDLEKFSTTCVWSAKEEG